MKDSTKLLPIGSVVMLNNGTKEVMITGFYSVSADEPNNIYDYCGCMYPEGLISSEQNLLFNHSQIVKILHMGYNSEKEAEFKQKLANAVNKIDAVNNNN